MKVTHWLERSARHLVDRSALVCRKRGWTYTKDPRR